MNALIKFGQAIQYEVRGQWGNDAVSFFFGVCLIISALLIAASILLVVVVLKYLFMKHRYKDIIDVDSAASRRTKEIDDLNKEYAKDKELYDKLKQELSLLEENIEDISVGLYKPHYDFKTSYEYKIKLDKIYEQKKQMIQNKQAVASPATPYVDGSKSAGQRLASQYSKLMLRAFNGESDAAILKVEWNNVVRMRERIIKAFEAINKLGKSLLVSITVEYLNLQVEELELTYEYEEKLHQEKEEQRRIQAEMREEERVQIEIEKAKREAEDEELRYQKALDKAKAEVEFAKGKEVQQLNNTISMLEQKLIEAKELKERAVSRAQLTKSGHVYLISNIGSFGENVFKIGMTRRLEPFDRIRELGDASVPFQFDVHAMIYSDNAPELESTLHAHLEEKRINLVNPRKEFFNVLIDEIAQICKEKDLKIELTKLAEAREYRETLALRERIGLPQITEQVPSSAKQLNEIGTPSKSMGLSREPGTIRRGT